MGQTTSTASQGASVADIRGWFDANRATDTINVDSLSKAMAASGTTAKQIDDAMTGYDPYYGWTSDKAASYMTPIRDYNLSTYGSDFGIAAPKPVVAPVASSSIATYTPTTQEVDQSGLVKNQMAGLLNSDSSYMQSARTRAQQAGQTSGLLNSSLAGTAGEKAASDAALSIATPDAAAVNTQSLANQSALNTAGQFNANWANDFNKLALQQQYALQSAGYGAELQAGLNSQSQAATAAQNTQQQAATAALNAQQQAATKAAADSAQAQTIYTAMNTLKTDASKYVTSIMADTTLDDAAKAATIKSYLATATATQAGYNAQLAVLNYAPGAYFDFSTLSGR